MDRKTMYFYYGERHSEVLVVAQFVALTLSSEQVFITFTSYITDINECTYKLCKNGAQCFNLMGTYLCFCKSGYSGRNCEKGKKRVVLPVCLA